MIHVYATSGMGIAWYCYRWKHSALMQGGGDSNSDEKAPL